jgi:hypothetical protein
MECSLERSIWQRSSATNAKLGAARSDIEALLRPLPLQVVPVDIKARVHEWSLPAGWPARTAYTGH